MITRTYIAGVVLSGLLHGGFLYLDRLFPNKPPPPKPKEEVSKLLLLVQKEIEPEEIEFDNTNEPQAKAPEVSVPRAPEVFTPVTVEVFTQKPEPPSPTIQLGTVVTIPNTVGRPGSGRNGREIFNLLDVDQPPVAKFQAKPVYPFEMRRQGIEGDVLVGFIVNANGSVQDAYAIRSSHREFEASAILAVSKWKFRPGMKRSGENGRKEVNTRMQVPVVFSITNE